MSSHTVTYITEIERVPVVTRLKLSEIFKWNIITNNNNSFISFGASKAILMLLKTKHLVNRQHFINSERTTISRISNLNT